MAYPKKSRQRTRNSFIASVVIHVIAVLMTNVSFHLYLPFQRQPEPLVEEEAVKVELFYAEVVKKPVFRQPGYHSPPTISKDSSASITKPKRAATKRRAIKSKPSAARFARKPDKARSMPLTSQVQMAATADMGLSSASQDAKSPRTISELEVTVKGGTEDKKTDESIPGVGSDGEEMQPVAGDLSVEAQIGGALKNIAEGIATKSETDRVDVVFLLDTSGSMAENIRAVGNHLNEMADTFVQNRLDFTLGVVKFRYGDILVFPQTSDISKYQRLLKNANTYGTERAYDAIMKAITRVQFRDGAARHFIMVTDEKMSGSFSATEILRRCQSGKIKLDIIGIDDEMQKALARATGGTWYPIPN